MSDDDDGDCTGHVWRLEGVTFRPPNLEAPGTGGSWSTYACVKCDAVLPVGPGGLHPEGV